MGFKKVILFTNPHNEQNLELFHLFKDYSPYPTIIPTHENIGSVREIKESIVLLCGFNRDFLDLDKSNLVLYFARKPYLSSKEVLLLPILTTIVAESHQAACSIRSQIASYNQKTPVIKAIPWCRPQEQEDDVNSSTIYYPKNNKCFGSALLTYINGGGPLESWFCVVEDTYETIKLMRAGKPVMVPNRAPLNELIFHKFNGFLIDIPGDVVDSLRDFGKYRAYIGRMAHTSVQALLEPRKYIDHLLTLRKVSKQPFTYKEAPKWIIQQKLFESGKVTYFPEDFNDNLKTSTLSDFIEILEFFQTRLYSDVYVFGFDFPNYEATEMHKAKLLSKKYRKNGLKIHFCLDLDTPQTWNGIFTNFSIISVDEGLKQVQK